MARRRNHGVGSIATIGPRMRERKMASTKKREAIESLPWNECHCVSFSMTRGVKLMTNNVFYSLLAVHQIRSFFVARFWRYWLQLERY